MSSELIQHVDYRSKAEDRRRELEQLQEKKLARTKASRLRDASAPIEAGNFLEKQRELFATRRRKQADAIEFLHQYRAGDELVLQKAAAARKSLGSKSYKFSARHNLTSGLSSSSSDFNKQRKWPDARASVCSYAAYPTFIPFEKGSEVERDPMSQESHPSRSPRIIPDIDKTSVCFHTVSENLATIVKEASRLPLPEDIDNDNTTDLLLEVTDNGSQCDDSYPRDRRKDGIIRKQNSHNVLPQSAQERESKESVLDHNDRGGFDGEVMENNIGDKVENNSNHPIQIQNDAIDIDHINQSEARVMGCCSPSSNDICNFEVDLVNVESNQSEAFSESGESLAIEPKNDNNYSKDALEIETKVLKEVRNNDDRIIHRHKISSTQASPNITTNDMLFSKHKEEEEDLPSRESLEFSIDKSNTTKASTTLIPCTEKSPSMDRGIEKEAKNDVTLDVTCYQSVHHGLGTETKTNHLSTNSRTESHEQLTQACKNKKNSNAQDVAMKCKNEDSTVQSEKSNREPEIPFSAIQNDKHFECSLHSDPTIDDVNFDKYRPTPKSNVSAQPNCDGEPNAVECISNPRDEPHGSITAETIALNQTTNAEEEPQQNDLNKTNILDRIRNSKESEHRSLGNSHVATSVDDPDTASSPRPKRKKKKKSGKSYYPASSFFAHRQFISR